MVELFQAKRKPTTAAADTSSEVAKKMKDQFRNKVLFSLDNLMNLF